MKRVALYVWRILLETNTPLWVTLIGFCFATLGVYYITPLINQNLERQKIKTEYVIRSLDNINGRTQEMLAEISIANRRIASGQSNYTDNLDKALRLATELQWKAIEVGAVLDDRRSSLIIHNFQEKLGRTYNAVSNTSSAGTALIALQSVKDFIPASLMLTRRIAKLSGIKFPGN